MHAKYLALLLPALALVYGQSDSDSSPDSDPDAECPDGDAVCLEMAIGFNPAAASYLATVKYDTSLLAAAELAAPTELAHSITQAANGPAELKLLQSLEPFLPETAHSVMSSILEVALSLQTAVEPETTGSASSSSSVSSAETTGRGLTTRSETASSSTRVQGVAGHGTGTAGPAATSARGGSGGQGMTPSQSVVVGAAANSVDNGFVAMAGIVAGVAGLAFVL